MQYASLGTREVVPNLRGVVRHTVPALWESASQRAASCSNCGERVGAEGAPVPAAAASSLSAAESGGTAPPGVVVTAPSAPATFRKGVMYSVLMEASTPIYPKLESTSPSSYAAAQTVIEIRKLFKKNNRLEIRLPEGTTGYIAGETRVFTIKDVKLLQDQVEWHEGPSGTSLVREVLRKKTRGRLEGQVVADGETWARLRLENGEVGYINGKTRIQQQNTAKVEMVQNPGKDIAYGALWCVGGIVVTAVTYSSASSSPQGGTYFIVWGPVLYGRNSIAQGPVPPGLPEFREARRAREARRRGRSRPRPARGVKFGRLGPGVGGGGRTLGRRLVVMVKRGSYGDFRPRLSCVSGLAVSRVRQKMPSQGRPWKGVPLTQTQDSPQAPVSTPRALAISSASPRAPFPLIMSAFHLSKSRWRFASEKAFRAVSARSAVFWKASAWASTSASLNPARVDARQAVSCSSLASCTSVTSWGKRPVICSKIPATGEFPSMTLCFAGIKLLRRPSKRVTICRSDSTRSAEAEGCPEAIRPCIRDSSS